MRATELKKKYPQIWKAVESQVCDDQFERDIQVIAHNAAFVACSEHHKALKALKATKGN